MVTSRVVFTRKLQASHQTESFTTFLPLNDELVAEIRDAVKEIFDALGGKDRIKSSGNVYVKPNGIDAKPYSYTRPEVVTSVIDYWFKAGAKNIYLMENSTQANCTRVVFESNGYKEICRQTGAIPIYLDEDKTVPFELAGRGSGAGRDADGYDLTRLEMPVTVVEQLIDRGGENLYVNLPKLKTHSMTGVTLGIKNQWGFPVHASRGMDHNYHLHSKLVDVLSYLRPDITLIEGVEGSIYGHYPPLALADACVKPFRLLIGSRNVVAADLVGARIFGLEMEDIHHLRIAVERGLGGEVTRLQDIEMTGDITSPDSIDLIGDMPKTGSYPTDLYDAFPDNVKIMKGKELACREGCVNNPLTFLQILYNDYHGKGGWTLLMGKGFDTEEVLELEGRVLIAGHCAIEEVSQLLINKLGKRNVYLSGECNDLSSTAEAMFHLMQVNPTHLVPIHPVRALSALITARLKGSKSRVPSLLSHMVKRV